MFKKREIKKAGAGILVGRALLLLALIAPAALRFSPVQAQSEKQAPAPALEVGERVFSPEHLDRGDGQIAKIELRSELNIQVGSIN